MIPVYKPTIGDREKRNVMECLDSEWISSKGVFVARFEQEFSRYLGSRHAITMSNGTTALHAALVALGVGPGDEVIVPTLTYVATANAVTYTGAKVVFVDSTRDTWQIDPQAVEQAITPATRAIIPVHLYGHACDMEAICAVAKEHRLLVVEDCAEALGTFIGPHHVGTFGDIATFSFYGNKTITTGEGGMIATNDENLADRSFRIRGQGLAKSREYWHDIIGYNYRMTNICAAIGCAQLEQISTTLEAKRKIALMYRNHLSDLVEFQPIMDGMTHSHWMVSFLVKDQALRDPLREALAAAGVETRPVFFPVHTMPIYSDAIVHAPIAEDLASRGISVPSYPQLSEKQVEYITGQCRRFLETKGESTRAC
jgi:perosamine synthetase